MKLYVGNLSREVTAEDLKGEFSAFGEVSQVTIAKDRSNTVSKGFAFVEMPIDAEAKSAIEGLHLKEMKGRSLDVTEARPRPAHSHHGARGGRQGRSGRRSR